MATASTSMVRLSLPRTLLRRSSIMASSSATATTTSKHSSARARPTAHSHTHHQGMHTSSRLCRPSGGSQPARAPAAEPAVVKSPSDPPNPVPWPGMPKKADAAAASQSRGQSAGEIPFGRKEAQPQPESVSPSVPHAESSKAALEREQQTAQQAAAKENSDKSDQGACATLSPSSPAAPRSQGKEKTKAAESEAPKALAPEEVSKPAPSAGKFSAPNKAGKAFRAKKEAITLTPTAVERLRELLESDSGPRLIRIGVRNKGCAGMSYHLEYVTPDQAGKFDERVRQDGVEVLVDSKALFSIIGSEMDWKEDTLSAKFVFNNPNVKESCGCGESFLT